MFSGGKQSIGQLINKLIWSNIRVWHTATLIKKENKPTMSLEEKAKIYLECRKDNSDRSAIRSNIDKIFGGLDDRKVNYL